MGMMIDTHAHLYAEEFDADRLDMLERARREGIGRIILPGIDRTSILPLKELANAYPDFCFPAAGVHPTSIREDFEEELAAVRQELETGRYLAVGEIGIDLYWDKTFLPEQKEALSRQLQWSLEYKLPVIIHVRDSFEETFDVMEAFRGKGLKGIFHSFTGTAEQADNIFGLGEFYLGINGIVTFKNSGLAATVAGIPLSKIVLETDAPYLTPVPFRGKRNESSYLKLIAEKLEEVYGLEKDEICRITTENANGIFGLGNLTPKF